MLWAALQVLTSFSFLCTASTSPVLDYIPLSARTTNTTSHISSEWVSGPDGRGTYSLLFSCFSTLFLCAWTAFHPNIPSSHSDARNMLERVKWMMIAIFVPEAVLYCAWSQWWAARDLKDEINRLGRHYGRQKLRTTFTKRDRKDCEDCMKQPSQSDRRQSSESNPNHSTHSEDSACPSDDANGNPTPSDDICQLGVQDGLSEPTKDFVSWTSGQAFFAISGGLAVDTSGFSDRPWRALNPNGIVLLAEIGLLPHLSKQDVDSRSQADAIAKSLSCLQASWFFVQTIARRFAGLPITLLEIHTLIHIACALLLYGLWFKKPYGVSSPIVLSDPATINITTLMAMQVAGATSRKMCCPMQQDACISREHWEEQRAEYYDTFFSAEQLRNHAHLDAADKALDYLHQRKIHIGYGNLYWRDFFTKRTSNRVVRGRFDNGVKKMDTPMVKIITFLFMVLYGGSHMSAWNSHFPTIVEMWIWRAGSITMVVSPFLMAIVMLFEMLNEKAAAKVPMLDTFEASMQATTASRLWCWIIVDLLYKFSLGMSNLLFKRVYAYVRLYFLVEALISLRSPPSGTYQTVNWTSFIPHFS